MIAVERLLSSGDVGNQSRTKLYLDADLIDNGEVQRSKYFKESENNCQYRAPTTNPGNIPIKHLNS